MLKKKTPWDKSGGKKLASFLKANREREKLFT
jgi:hypothetical protein